MICVKDLNLTINKNVILKNINITFEAGKIYGLIGNNGSGKTMLMKCICGFVAPTSGEVVYLDKVVGKNIDYLYDAGVIIETPVFIPYYTGFKNLKVLSSIKKNITSDDIKNTIELCGLDPSLKIPVRKYSLGMRQRLAIAQAMMENPKVLVLDEPMNGLDINGVLDIRELLLRKKEEGCLIILACHNKEDIDVLCDEVYRMENGIIRKML